MEPRALSSAPAAAAPRVDSAYPRTGAEAGQTLHMLVALSEDSALLEAVGFAAEGQIRVITSPSSDRFIDQLVSTAAQMALIDAAACGPDLEAFIADLSRQFPNLLLILAGPAQLQHQFSQQISRGAIFRFAHKPTSAQRLKLFVDAGVRHLGAAEQPTAFVASGVALPAEMPSTRGSGGTGRALRTGAIAMVVLAAAVIAARLYWHPNSSAAQPESAPPPPAAVSAPAATITDNSASTAAAIDSAAAAKADEERMAQESRAREAALMAQVQRTASGAKVDQAHVYVQLARKRLATGALLDPADDSARTYVDAASSLAADDADVRAVAVALGEALIAKFHDALMAGNVGAAQSWLAACSDYHVGAATLSQLNAQLSELQQTQSAHAQQLQSQQQDFAQRLAAGQLIEPADASALAIYRKLKESNPTDPALSGMQRSLATALAAEVQARVSHQQLNSADLMLRTARDSGIESDELSSAATALAAAHASAAAAVAVAAAPTAPTATVVSDADDWVAESSLKRQRFVPPVYPAQALARNVTGSVDLEFTLNTDGRVQDIHVRDADPPGVFDQAAIKAASECRYEPVRRNGVAVTQRVRMKLRFAL